MLYTNKHILFTILAFLFLSISAAAFATNKTASDTTSVKMLNQKTVASSSMQNLIGLLSSCKSFQADFKQTSHNQAGKALQKVQGAIKLQKPGQFYWQAFQPYPQLLISNGKTIWQYDEDLEQVIVKEYRQQVRSVDLVMLLDNPQLLSNMYKVSHYHDDKKKQTQRFSLDALDTSSAIRSITFVFVKHQLGELTFIDSMKQQTVMLFTNRKINQVIPGLVFDFKIPKGADVLYENNGPEK